MGPISLQRIAENSCGGTWAKAAIVEVRAKNAASNAVRRREFTLAPENGWTEGGNVPSGTTEGNSGLIVQFPGRRMSWQKRRAIPKQFRTLLQIMLFR
jgi:hypothetical protein